MCGEINLRKEEAQNECQCQFNLKLTDKEMLGSLENIAILPEEIVDENIAILPEEILDENIAILPEEILEKILSNLTRDSLMEAVLVCKYWNEVVSS